MTLKTARTKVALNITSFVLHLFLNILFYVFVIFAITKLSTIAYDFAYEVFGNVALEEAPGRNVTIQIKKGESTMNVSTKLEVNRVIVNRYSFYLKAKLTQKNLMPGTFIVNSSQNYEEILTNITDLSKNLELDPKDQEAKKDTSGN